MKFHEHSAVAAASEDRVLVAATGVAKLYSFSRSGTT